LAGPYEYLHWDRFDAKRELDRMGRDDPDPDATHLQTWLNMYGADGWQLVFFT
jgi:hypothetical protein